MALKGKITLIQNILTTVKTHDSFLRGLVIFILKENLKNTKINTNGIGLLIWSMVKK